MTKRSPGSALMRAKTSPTSGSAVWMSPIAANRKRSTVPASGGASSSATGSPPGSSTAKRHTVGRPPPSAVTASGRPDASAASSAPGMQFSTVRVMAVSTAALASARRMGAWAHIEIDPPPMERTCAAPSATSMPRPAPSSAIPTSRSSRVRSSAGRTQPAASRTTKAKRGGRVIMACLRSG